MRSSICGILGATFALLKSHALSNKRIANSHSAVFAGGVPVESADEAAANAEREAQIEGTPKPRTNLKPEIFGA